MGSVLDALLELQQVELKLTALKSKIDGKMRGVRTRRNNLANLERELALKHDAIRHQRAAVGQVELEIKTHEAEVSKLRDALNKSKTNKEYAAILTQINTQKADTSKQEDRALSLMNEVDTLVKQEQALIAQIDQEKSALESSRQTVEAFERESQDELRALEQERSHAAADVPVETLTVFERTAQRHDGEALAMVVQPNPKRQEFICDGCNMGLTLEQYVALQSRDDLQLCINCSRILFLDKASLSC